MKTILTITFLSFSPFFFSQDTPPTLSFGLDKVLFGKGAIDVDLLTEIIVEKQDELKDRIIEQEILEPVFKNTSFATKNYVFSVVRDLLQEKDKNVLKKQLMEQTVNYAVVYAIAELFVSKANVSELNETLRILDSTELKIDSNQFIQLFPKNKISRIPKTLSDLEKINLLFTIESNSISNTSSKKSIPIDIVYHYKIPKYERNEDNQTSALYTTNLWKLPWIANIDVRHGRQDNFKGQKDDVNYKNAKVSKKRQRCLFKLKDHNIDSVAFNDLLMDCILQAIISDGKFKNKGFFNKPFYFNLDQYQSMSYYHRFKEDSVTIKLYNQVNKFVSNISDLYESFELLEKYLSNFGNGKNEFSKDKFKTYARQRLEGLSRSLREIQLNDINQEIRRVEQNYYDTIEVLKTTKIKYGELIESYDNTYNLDSVERCKNDVKYTKQVLKGLIEEYKIDTSNLQSALNQRSNWSANRSYFDNLKLKHPLNYQDTALTTQDLTNELNKSKKESARIISDLTIKMNGLNKYENLIFADSIDLKEKVKNLESLRKDVADALRKTKELIDVSSLKMHVLLDSLQEELFNVADSSELDLTEKQDSIVQKLYRSFYHLRHNQHKVINFNYVEYLMNEILPPVQMLNIKAQGRLSEVARLIEQIAILIEYKVVQKLVNKLNNGLSPEFEELFAQKDNQSSLSFFLKFFEHLDKLDEIDTYYYLLEQLKVAGEQSDDRDIANAISLITQSIEKYSKFDPEAERIDLDVELIISALHNRYGERDKNPFNFHLTLGLNNAFSLNDSTMFDTEGKSIRNLGYASEKIGIRWNIYNSAMRHSYLAGETKPRSKKNYFHKNKVNYNMQPLVSNFHALLYGSGFLYQLADLGTTKDIKSTFAGAGLGLTFYNNLNFNVTYMLPLKYDGSTKLGHGAVNIGFDIYFTEYLTALNKKRKANKKVKLEAKYEYQKAQNKALVGQTSAIR